MLTCKYLGIFQVSFHRLLHSLPRREGTRPVPADSCGTHRDIYRHRLALARGQVPVHVTNAHSSAVGSASSQLLTFSVSTLCCAACSFSADFLLQTRWSSFTQCAHLETTSSWRTDPSVIMRRPSCSLACLVYTAPLGELLPVAFSWGHMAAACLYLQCLMSS